VNNDQIQHYVDAYSAQRTNGAYRLSAYESACVSMLWTPALRDVQKKSGSKEHETVMYLKAIGSVHRRSVRSMWIRELPIRAEFDHEYAHRETLPAPKRPVNARNHLQEAIKALN
jgi:hypothetical protein